MSVPGRLAIEWSVKGRADLRAIPLEDARRILECIDRFSRSRDGDVKKLKEPQTDLRLRCGDFRVFFRPAGPDAIEVLRVVNRSDAY
jgi:mRNA-degrading endonuclease RelE of RelBE toxin-antitoxin system